MTSPQRKIDVTSKSPVGDISVVTLIRTDTTLDHSQKAEKVCCSRASAWGGSQRIKKRLALLLTTERSGGGCGGHAGDDWESW